MTQHFQVFDLEAVKAKIKPPYTAEGILVDLTHGDIVRLRIRRRNGNVYRGVTDDGKSVMMNIVTGKFDISD